MSGCEHWSPTLPRGSEDIGAIMCSEWSFQPEDFSPLGRVTNCLSFPKTLSLALLVCLVPINSNQLLHILLQVWMFLR